MPKTPEVKERETNAERWTRFEDNLEAATRVYNGFNLSFNNAMSLMMQWRTSERKGNEKTRAQNALNAMKKAREKLEALAREVMEQAQRMGPLAEKRAGVARAQYESAAHATATIEAWIRE